MATVPSISRGVMATIDSPVNPGLDLLVLLKARTNVANAISQSQQNVVELETPAYTAAVAAAVATPPNAKQIIDSFGPVIREEQGIAQLLAFLRKLDGAITIMAEEDQNAERDKNVVEFFLHRSEDDKKKLSATIAFFEKISAILDARIKHWKKSS